MSIHQINMTFDPEEDRIVFRVNTVSKEEFRLHLTRRLVKRLWPALTGIIHQEFKSRKPDQAHQTDLMVPFERQKILEQTDQKTSFNENAQRYPLGESCLLITRFQVKFRDNNPILCFYPSSGSGVELSAHPTFLHGLCELLAKTVKKAEWEIELKNIDDSGQNLQLSKTLH